MLQPFTIFETDTIVQSLYAPAAAGIRTPTFSPTLLCSAQHVNHAKYSMIFFLKWRRGMDRHLQRNFCYSSICGWKKSGYKGSCIRVWPLHCQTIHTGLVLGCVSALFTFNLSSLQRFPVLDNMASLSTTAFLLTRNNCIRPPEDQGNAQKRRRRFKPDVRQLSRSWHG